MQYFNCIFQCATVSSAELCCKDQSLNHISYLFASLHISIFVFRPFSHHTYVSLRSENLNSSLNSTMLLKAVRSTLMFSSVWHLTLWRNSSPTSMKMCLKNFPSLRDHCKWSRYNIRNQGIMTILKNYLLECLLYQYTNSFIISPLLSYLLSLIFYFRPT